MKNKKILLSVLIMLSMPIVLLGQGFSYYTLPGVFARIAAPTKSAGNAMESECFWISNSSNSGSSYITKSVHFTLSGVQAGDSVVVVSSATGYKMRSSKGSSWLDITTSSITASGGTNVQRGWVLSAGDTAIDVEIRDDRTSSQTSFTNAISFYYRPSGSAATLTRYLKLFCQVHVNDYAYKWIGSDSGQFTTSTNWMPERSSVNSNDVLIFEDYKPIWIKMLNTGTQINQTISQFIITAYSDLRLINYRGSNGSNAKSIINLTSGNNVEHYFGTYYNSNTSVKDMYSMSISASQPEPAGDFEIARGGKITICGNDSVHFNLGASTTFSINVYGGSHLCHFLGDNSKGNGASLKFYFGGDPSSNEIVWIVKPESGTSIIFDGDNQDLPVKLVEFYSHTPPTTGDDIYFLGGEGDVVFGPGLDVELRNGDAGNIYLGGNVKVYGGFDIISNAPTLFGNDPASSSSSDWVAWEPYLQFCDGPTGHGYAKNGCLSRFDGGVKWEIYNSGNRAWRTVGYPFDGGMHVSQISRNIVITGDYSGDNKDSFYSFNSSCNGCAPSLYSWDSQNETWSAFESGNTANKINNGEGVLLFFRGMGSSGIGNSSSSAAPGTMEFKGNPLTGDKTVNLTYNSSGGNLKGVNLVANPYMFNIDWNEVYTNTSTANISDKYYLFDPVAKTYNTYDKSTGSVVLDGSTLFESSTTTEARTIEQGAAFFVVATANSPAIQFQENDAIYSDPKISAFREERIHPCNQIKAKIYYSKIQSDLMDHCVLEWDMSNNGALDGRDFMDMSKLWAGYLGIGSKSPDGEWLTIDRRPDLEFGKSLTIDLDVRIPTNDEYKINFDACKVGSNANVILVDRETKKEINVTEGGEYTFSANKNAASDRFFLKISKTTTSVNTISDLNMRIYPNPSHGVLNLVSYNGDQNIKELCIYDLAGRLLSRTNDVNFGEWQLPDSLENGQYLINVKLSNGDIYKNKIQLLR